MLEPYDFFNNTRLNNVADSVLPVVRSPDGVDFIVRSILLSEMFPFHDNAFKMTDGKFVRVKAYGKDDPLFKELYAYAKGPSSSSEKYFVPLSDNSYIFSDVMKDEDVMFMVKQRYFTDQFYLGPDLSLKSLEFSSRMNLGVITYCADNISDKSIDIISRVSLCHNNQTKTLPEMMISLYPDGIYSSYDGVFKHRNKVPVVLVADKGSYDTIICLPFIDRLQRYPFEHARII